jgi:uncharacterized membrane protein HdeD (DUF308 family)
MRGVRMKEESNLSLILTSFLSLVLGISLIVATEDLLVSVNYILVCLFTIIGVVQVISFFINKNYKYNLYNKLILGTIFIWLAIFIYVYYTMIIIILPIIFSLYSVIMAVVLIIKYFNLKNITKIKYKRYIILSIISLVIGLFLIFRPTLSIYTYFKITGVYVIFISMAYFLEFIDSIRQAKKNS